jgi:hypothetical protein
MIFVLTYFGRWQLSGFQRGSLADIFVHGPSSPLTVVKESARYEEDISTGSNTPLGIAVTDQLASAISVRGW